MLVTLALALGPLFALGYLDSVRVRNDSVEERTRDMLGTAHVTAQTIEHMNVEHIHIVQLLAENDRVSRVVGDPTRRPDRVADLLVAFSNSTPTFSGATIFDAEGRTLISTDTRMSGQRVDGQRYFRTALSGVPNASDLMLTGDVVGPQIVYAAPIRDTSGAIIGVATLRSDATEIFRLIDADRNSVGVGSSGLLIDPRGVRLYDGRRGELQFTGEPETDLLNALQGAHDNEAVTIEQDGTTWHVAAASVPGQAWTYFVRVPDHTFSEASDGLVRNAVIVIAGMAVVVGLLTFYVASSITRPIRRVVDDARRLAVGDIASSPSADGGRSIGQEEVDQLRIAFDGVRAYLTRLAGAATSVAEGDLSRDAEPQSPADVVGHAFKSMIHGLRALDAQVAERTSELVRSNHELDASLGQLRDAQRRAAFLADASKQLARSLDYDATLQAIARSTVPELADWCSVTLLKEDGSIQQVALAHLNAEHEALARELNERYPRRASDRHNPTSRVLESGKSEVLTAITPDTMRAMCDDDVHFSYWRALNPQSLVVVPLIARGRTIGALTLVRTTPGIPCGEAELQLTEELALRAAQAVDNARLYRAAQVEILERRRVEEALEYQASHDSLTELPNRAVLHERLEAELCSTHLGPALLLMDLDGFKEINDTLGHHAGDELLKGVAARLRMAIRAGDHPARLGGDEFGLLLPSTSPDAALQVAENVLRALEEPFTVEGQQVSVGASLGLAVCPDDGSDASTLLRHADVAMYAAKQAHIGVARYAPEQDQHNAGRLALASELREALGRDELVLHYQPKRNLRSGRIVRVEALVRWQHPAHGLMSPDTFVPLAESTGLIGLLDRWVLNAALRQSAEWRADGLDVPVAVNLSVQDLRDRGLPELIAGLLRHYEVPAEGLILEITETGLLGDPARAFEVLQGLRALGLQIAIDDFGAGNAALGYLKHLPVDELKIDRSFVQDMRQNIGDAAIVRATIDLAHRLGMAVVAEGVEDGATLDVLAALGCDLAQGYYISRPLAASAFVEWLRAHPAMGSVSPQSLRRAA
ncbi:MAG: hypothetical protein NVSMB2_07580 [Chloroflexota bacterium]